MHQTLLTLGADGEIAIVALLAAAAAVILPLGFSALRTVLVARTREKTRREIAAYVAEGTLTADQAVAFVRAAGEADARDVAVASRGRCGSRGRDRIAEPHLA